MDVILMQRIEKLGQMGDVVSVKPGYARNYLLPQHKAMRATKSNLDQFEMQKVQLEAENLQRREEAEKVAEKVSGLRVTLIRQAGESGQLYGSVSARDLAEAATQSGVTIERGQVILDRVVKTLGLHAIKIQLHPEVAVEITANVARSDEEAEVQAAAGRMVSAEELRRAEEAAEAAVEAVVDAAIEDEEAIGTADEASEADEDGIKPET